MTDEKRAMSTVFDSTLLEGHVWKRGGKVKNWLERWFVLDSRGFLSYYKRKGGKLIKSFDLSKSVGIRETTIEEWAKKGINPPTQLKESNFLECWELNIPSRTFYFASTDAENSWVSEVSCSRADACRQVKLALDGSRAKSKDLLDNAVFFGWVTKLGRKVKNWKRRFLLLTTKGQIVYSADQTTINSPLGYTHVRYIDELKPPEACTWKASLPKGVDPSCCFEIVTQQRNFQIYCDTSDEVDAWIDQIEGACLFYSLNLTSFTPQSRSNTLGSLFSLNVENHDTTTNEGNDDNDSPAPDNDDLESSLNPEQRHEVEEELKSLCNGEDRSVRRNTLSAAVSLRRKTTSKKSTEEATKRVVILYNPVSGSGKGKNVAENHVAPVLRLAKVEYVIVPTQYAGHATEFVLKLDLKGLHGLVVCGGDGLVSEVMTGLLNRKDNEAKNFPIGIIPAGTANAMANVLDGGHAANDNDLIGRAALAVAKGNTRSVDVLSINIKRTPENMQGFIKGPMCNILDNASEHSSVVTTDDDSGDEDVVLVHVEKKGEDIDDAVEEEEAGLLEEEQILEEYLYGLSCIGWGLAGVCTARAQKLRWLPGQKKIRYDVAGFLTLLKDWPVVCDCLFEWRDAETGEWKEEQVGMINMIASNMDKLGVAHAICRDIQPDDGNICVAIIDDTNSRSGTVAAAMTLKKGKYLADHKNVRTFITPEFKITPTAGSKAEHIPYNLDGDPIDAGTMHVKVLHKAMNVFAQTQPHFVPIL